MFRTHALPDIPIILAGTKLDIIPPELIESTNDRAKEMAISQGSSGYFLTSSKTNTNVEKLVAALLELLLARAKHEKLNAVSLLEQ